MMADFWDYYKDITDQVIILYIISVIQYYANTYYYKTPYLISYLFEEKDIDSFIL